MSEIPYGYCHCGCGKKTLPYTASNRQKGYRKGEPAKYLKGHNNTPTDAIKRFWSKVNIGNEHECWTWKGFCNDFGHGKFSNWNGIGSALAHRVSFTIAFGEIPDEMCVLHRCDNPPCVNPNHLFLGTRADNNADRDAKDRGNNLFGSKHGMAILKENDISEIIRLAMSGLNNIEIGKIFHTSHSNISQIIGGKAWKRALPEWFVPIRRAKAPGKKHARVKSDNHT